MGKEGAFCVCFSAATRLPVRIVSGLSGKRPLATGKRGAPLSFPYLRPLQGVYFTRRGFVKQTENRGRELIRALGVTDSVAIMVGVMIGVGIFRVPGSIAAHLHAPSAVLSAWIVGGLLALCGGLCYAELSASLPKAGGDYVYLRDAYGSTVGFLFGWTKLLVIRPGSIAGIAFIFAGYADYFVPLHAFGTRAIAVGAILVLTAVNLFGLRYGKQAQNLLVVGKLAGILFLIGAGFLSGEGSFDPDPVESREALPFLGAFGMALIFIMWTYGGWNESTYMAEEMRRPTKDLPSSIAGGIGVTALLYVLINAAYLYRVPSSMMANSEMVASLLAERLFGPAGGAVIAGTIMLFALGAVNGLILTGGRISYAFGNDQVAFGRLASVHGRYRTPAVGLILNGLWASVLVASGEFDRLVSYTSAVTWFFFGLTGASVYVLRRKRAALARPYRVWGLIPAIFVVSSAWLFYNTLLYSPREALLGVAIMLSGLPRPSVCPATEQTRGGA